MTTTLFDTHTHLNFSRFKKNVDEVIQNSRAAGVAYMLIPGTDVPTSKKAVEIAEQYENMYAAVGIHPHHAVEVDEVKIPSEIAALEALITTSPKIKAVGEVGLDRHEYIDTKYEKYEVSDEFLRIQKILLIEQLKLAKKHKLSVILHNREAKDEILDLLLEHWDSYFEGRMVFHCCEPEEEILAFCIARNIYIGVDGDITHDTPDAEKKREFIKKVPGELLVLETDSPFLLPEPLRFEKKYPNTPANLPLVGECVAKNRGVSPSELFSTTTENAIKLFNIL